MKKGLLWFLLAIVLFSAFGAQAEERETVALTDFAQRTVQAPLHPQCVVALSASIAEAWLQAGGALRGATEDAFEQLGLAEDVQIIGTIKEPNAEVVLSLAPDLVLITDDIASHASLIETLEAVGIASYAVSLDTLEDYVRAMTDFTRLTGREDLYEQNVTAVTEEIDQLLSRLPENAAAPTALFLRAFSTGVKVKARDHVVCDILADIGADNVAAGNPALEELSLEAIVAADPQFLFVVTMGSDEEKALAAFDALLASNPAWGTLTAVQEGRVYVLPRELFHYKPNARWAEAYKYLLAILYPDLYASPASDEAA